MNIAVGTLSICGVQLLSAGLGWHETDLAGLGWHETELDIVRHCEMILSPSIVCYEKTRTSHSSHVSGNVILSSDRHGETKFYYQFKHHLILALHNAS